MGISKKRAPNLSEEAIVEILSIIDSWCNGRLTWAALTDAIEHKTKVKYTRQALAAHLRIQSAYSEKIKFREQRPAVTRAGSVVELDEALKIIDSQRAEIARLKKGELVFLEQFARWASNAHMLGIDHRRLDVSPDPVDRDSSLVSGSRLKSVV